MRTTSFVDTALAPVYGFKSGESAVHRVELSADRIPKLVANDQVLREGGQLGEGAYGQVVRYGVGDLSVAKKTFGPNPIENGTIFGKKNKLEEILSSADSPVVPFHVDGKNIYMDVVTPVNDSRYTSGVIEVEEWLVKKGLLFPDFKLDNLGMYKGRVVLIDVDGIIDSRAFDEEGLITYTYGWKGLQKDRSTLTLQGFFALCVTVLELNGKEAQSFGGVDEAWKELSTSLEKVGWHKTSKLIKEPKPESLRRARDWVEKACGTLKDDVSPRGGYRWP